MSVQSGCIELNELSFGKKTSLHEPSAFRSADESSVIVIPGPLSSYPSTINQFLGETCLIMSSCSSDVMTPNGGPPAG